MCVGQGSSPIWPGTGNPLGSDFADEQTTAGAANVLLPCRGILNRLPGETRHTHTHTGGKDKRTQEQCIRIQADKKPITLDGQELPSTVYGRKVFWERVKARRFATKEPGSRTPDRVGAAVHRLLAAAATITHTIIRCLRNLRRPFKTAAM